MAERRRGDLVTKVRKADLASKAREVAARPARAGKRPAPTLRIGIASVSEMRARTLAIARGELKPKPDDPKVWMPSPETFGKILSSKNRELLERIRNQKPASLQDLSSMTGRKVPSLSRTLKTMERYGLVTLERGERGKIRPVVPFEKVELAVNL
ncbi:MarR family transcriptional regulator [Microvirga massiliensis]|uniref:HVO_A0114 family putative DNA-binding protein n=1 Tax=Microvirga massiliensis TaxID=1033741 RepID=UPI000ADB0B92|nr:MarR family transcriptional regulator [Microvirga massiliensis]